MKSSTQVHLLIIDPQNDFCDIPQAEQPADPLAGGRSIAPALPVAGADQDMKRLAAFIERAGDKLFDIHVTLDSHNPIDIAHSTWWTNDKGQAPAPFTVIRTWLPACGARAIRCCKSAVASMWSSWMPRSATLWSCGQSTA